VSSARQHQTANTYGPEAVIKEIETYHPPLEGDFLFSNPVPLENLYQPHAGKLQMGAVERFDGGLKYNATYASKLAMHDVVVYKSGYGVSKPTVLMTSPLWTGTHGHNDSVAQDIARQGCDVVFKAVPHYYHPDDALTLTEDANEMHGLLNVLSQHTEVGLGSLEEINVYGESQAAMKLLGVVALSGLYGREVNDGMAVAACFLWRANLHNPVKLVRYGTSMVASIANAARGLSLEEAWELRKTVSLRDVHHHLAVLPVLSSGEAGLALPHIKPDQRLTNQFYGKDRTSRAHRSHRLMQAHFTNMDSYLDEKYGHVDGIRSKETKQLRRQIFGRIAARAMDQAA
jgi:hypothetical protein